MTNIEALAVLREIEWNGVANQSGYCPLCYGADHKGHTADCKLAELISEMEEIASAEDAEKWHNIECFERGDAELGGDA